MTDASNTRDKLLTVLVEKYGAELEVPFTGVSGRRGFRFDAAWPVLRIGLDYHGWGAGAAHRSRKKQAGDHEKVSEASLMGWRYIICDLISVDNGQCVAYVEHVLGIERIPEVTREPRKRGARARARGSREVAAGRKARG